MKRLLALFLTMQLSGCSVELKEYAGNEPKLLLEEYFQGKMVAYGAVQDYQEKLTRDFCVEIESTWKPDKNGNLKGELDEVFYFNDGEVEKRLWQIEKSPAFPTRYSGTAGDVEGTAEGEVAGNAFRWQYKLQLALQQDDGSEEKLTVSVDDWIYLLDENRAF